MVSRHTAAFVFWAICQLCQGVRLLAEVETLPDTAPLIWTGDIASRLVEGADRFLLGQIEQSIQKRAGFYNRDFSSPSAYANSLSPNRQRLARILGVREERVPFDAPRLFATVSRSALVGRGKQYEILAVHWPAFGDVRAEGLLLVPGGKPVADVIAIPDASQTPEQLVGLVPGVPKDSQIARRLAENGCRVLVPMIINRQPRHAGITNREFLYRSAFELGRHLIGYEIQKVLAGVDWFERDAAESGRNDANIGVVGWGEGGMLALYATALDGRIDAACVSGYFQPRESIWEQPIDRNVFGLLEQFGDAELAAMIAPRSLVVEAAAGPELILEGGSGAPAVLSGPQPDAVRLEVTWANEITSKLDSAIATQLVVSGNGSGRFGSDAALTAFLPSLHVDTSLIPTGDPPKPEGELPDAEQRHERQFHELDRHNQRLLRESSYVRKEFMKDLDTASLPAYEKSVEPYRNYFRDEVIGSFDRPLLAPNPRSRKAFEGDTWTGYEVVLDVFPDVFAYGILLLPKDLEKGEKRPAVVCQHGLEGRPQSVIGEDGYGAYKAFAAELAQRGFITFAPQNLYIFRDRFRTLQRKANPLKKTLFSLMVPQHQQIVNWLQSLPNVDPNRIAFYGLSYGGKSAMRIPPLVNEYCLSICSADFNEWVDKNASTINPHSYVFTGEYEIFEFDLGSTFNYAEMAALIAPRPFMVERGHFDGVASDETVGHEFAKVRHLYAARLKVPDRCTIEWFDGPHTINGQGTFEFLHRHLNWPVKAD